MKTSITKRIHEKLLNRINLAKTYVTQHKILSISCAICILGVSWWGYGALTSTAGIPKYQLTLVRRSNITATVTASGQIASTQTLDMKPQVTGIIVYVGVTPGQQVAAGTLIAEIDPTQAQKAVRDARANLQSAEIALAKIKKPADALTLTQAQNNLTEAQTNLGTNYQNGSSDIANSFVDLPTIMTGIQSVDFGTDAAGNANQWNIDYYGTAASKYDSRGNEYRNDAYTAYQAARVSYDKTFADYKAMPATPDAATVEKLLTETYATATLLQNAVKSTYTLIQFYNDQLTQAGLTPKTAATNNLSTLNGYTSKLSPHTTNLLADTNAIATSKASIIEKQQALSQTTAGADALDIESAELTVTQRQNALQDAQDTLLNYYIRAPFAGTIATVNVHPHDEAGGEAVATLITQKQLVTLSLNEVDAAKVALGNAATLTLDAIPNLKLNGSVAEVDPAGSISQGVVSYSIKIAFDSKDARIKSGMTANATISTATATSTLIVPASAVKTVGNRSFVQAFNPALNMVATSTPITTKLIPTRIPVTIGISDDTHVEILSGLEEGQQIVSRVTTTSTTATPTAAASGTGNRGGSPSVRL